MVSDIALKFGFWFRENHDRYAPKMEECASEGHPFESKRLDIGPGHYVNECTNCNSIYDN